VFGSCWTIDGAGPAPGVGSEALAQWLKITIKTKKRQEEVGMFTPSSRV
jgi:hypothetical protein